MSNHFAGTPAQRAFNPAIVAMCKRWADHPEVPWYTIIEEGLEAAAGHLVRAAVDDDRESHRAECQKLLDAANAAWDRLGEHVEKAVRAEREAIRLLVAAHGTRPCDDAPGTVRAILEKIDARGRC